MRWKGLAATLAGVIAAGSCGQPPERAVVAATDSIIVDTTVLRGATVPPDTGNIGEGRTSRASDDPFAAFGLAEPADAQATGIRPIDVWISNVAGEATVIRADAGMGAVLVDTVAAGDSVHVRLETSADSVLLSATGLSGALLGQEWVSRGEGRRRAVLP